MEAELPELRSFHCLVGIQFADGVARERSTCARSRFSQFGNSPPPPPLPLLRTFSATWMRTGTETSPLEL